MIEEAITTSQQVINEFLEDMRKQLIAYMDAEDRNATGKAKASIQVVNVTETLGQLVGAQYIQYVFKGRPPGKMPPINKIVDWCNARGLPRSYAWGVAKTIAESGTLLYQSGRNIFDEIITEAKIDAFIKSIAVIYTVKLNTEITSLFYPANNSK